MLIHVHILLRVVEARRRKFESRLEDDLADFLVRHEHLISNIPKVLRTMTVEEFVTKWDGSIIKYMESVAKARTDEGISVDIEASARKR